MFRVVPSEFTFNWTVRKKTSFPVRFLFDSAALLVSSHTVTVLVARLSTTHVLPNCQGAFREHNKWEFQDICTVTTLEAEEVSRFFFVIELVELPSEFLQPQFIGFLSFSESSKW